MGNQWWSFQLQWHIDGLVQEIRNSIANTLELHLSCTNPLMGQCKKDITPLLTHWSYIFLALTHRYMRNVRYCPALVRASTGGGGNYGRGGVTPCPSWWHPSGDQPAGLTQLVTCSGRNHPHLPHIQPYPWEKTNPVITKKLSGYMCRSTESMMSQIITRHLVSAKSMLLYHQWVQTEADLIQ